MAEHAAHHRFSYAEYLAREREMGLRHEFLVRIPPTGLSTYPDVAGVCGALEVDREDPNAGFVNVSASADDPLELRALGVQLLPSEIFANAL